MSSVLTGSESVASHARREIERQGEQLDNAAGRAFRLYLAARSEGRPAQEIAALKAAYETAASRCRSVRLAGTHGGVLRTVIAA